MWSSRQALRLTQTELGELVGLTRKQAQKAIYDVERTVTKWPNAGLRGNSRKYWGYATWTLG